MQRYSFWQALCFALAVNKRVVRALATAVLGVTMVRKNFAVALLGIVATFSACTQKSTNDTAGLSSFDLKNCVFDAKDPFESHARLPKGPHAGECYDTRQARSLVKLNAAEAAKYGGSAAGYLSVANVSHKDKFYVANIPVNAIKNVIFHLEHFPAAVPAGHTQLRLQFEENSPVTLVAQTISRGERPVQVRDLVLSTEALGQPGFSYDIFKGQGNPLKGSGEYGVVYRMVSLESKFDHMIRKQNHKVEQWKLNVTREESRRILEQFVFKSQSRGMNYMYDTLTLNCTTEAIAALDAGVDYNIAERIGKFASKLTDFYPNVIRASLVNRGLLPLDKSTDLVDLGVDEVATTFE
ncbi:DUF4105 domain-containing protein [bacterium]|nr:DUF4105 domain-containing protein [bacterium]